MGIWTCFPNSNPNYTCFYGYVSEDTEQVKYEFLNKMVWSKAKHRQDYQKCQAFRKINYKKYYSYDTIPN